MNKIKPSDCKNYIEFKSKSGLPIDEASMEWMTFILARDNRKFWASIEDVKKSIKKLSR